MYKNYNIFMDLNQYPHVLEVKQKELIVRGDGTFIKDFHKSKSNLMVQKLESNYKLFTQDGAEFELSLNECVILIEKIKKTEYYSTEIKGKEEALQRDVLDLIENIHFLSKDNRRYGSFAVRQDGGFVTTARSKVEGPMETAFVYDVDHNHRRVFANKKASLNSPLLHLFFKYNPQLNIFIHGHELTGKIVHNSYEFPGTIGENVYARKVESGELIYLNEHGYIVGFKNIQEYKVFYELE